MKIKIQTLVTLLITTAAFYSCSQKTTPPTLTVFRPTLPLIGIDSLLQHSEIDLSFYKPESAKFISHSIEITETFDKFDKLSVRSKDDKLFAKQKDLVLDLSLLSESAFTFPLSGAKVISPYGTRRGRCHTGIDLKTCANDTIVAAFDGIVRMSGRSSGYGNVIVIRHYNGLETVYSHNSKNMIQSGERVKAGTPIALMGRTGRATTEHVHFEVRINGEHFDPNLIIDFNRHTLQQKCLVFTPDAKGKIQINISDSLTFSN
ncbi:MAG: M23 family metallopeptidase [Odoribacter sp.]